ncbi:MAG: metallophosphoesterase family protein [Bryobacteraceae bacterium]
MTRIGLMSDTHGFLDPALFTHFAQCDEVWHAGDLGPAEVLHRLKAFKPLRAVFGNIDGAEMRAELPGDLAWDCEGVGVYMTHIGGYPGRYDARAKRELAGRKPDLFICGHSHIVRVMRDPAAPLLQPLLHMNPGACGNQGWHLKRTVLRFTVENRKIGNVESIELGPRGGGLAKP